MVSLVIQTILLMAIAFILGCIIGCLLRAIFGSASSSVRETGSGAAVGAVGIAGAAAVAATKRDAAVADATPPKPARVEPRKATPPKPAAPIIPAEKAEVAAPVGLVSTPPAKPVPTPKPVLADAPVAKAAPKAKASVAKAAPAKKPAKPSAADVAAVAAAVKVAAPAGAPDNLKMIRGIGPQNEGRLNNLGVTQFAQIAKWSAKDQRTFGEALAFPGRIEREEWVPQAKQLAKGEQTDFSTRVKAGSVSSSMGTANAGNIGKKPATLTEARGGKPDNLTLIDGVGNAIEKKMFRLGIYHFDQVAKMSKSELAWLGNAVGFPGRPERENWKGESKILGAGGTTDHANRVEKGQIKTSRKSRGDEKK